MVWANRDKTTEKGEKFMMAVINSGGLRLSQTNHERFSFSRTNLTAGDITLGDLLTVLPFEMSFDRVEVEGKILREVFERSASRWEERSGQFLQVQWKIFIRY